VDFWAFADNDLLKRARIQQAAGATRMERKARRQQSRATTLFVTHDQPEAICMATAWWCGKRPARA